MRGHIKLLAAALSAAGLMAACGGGGDSGTPPAPKPKVSSVKVAGDSLSDSGTFGFKFTVQGKDSDGKDFQVWAERIAAQYKVDLCPHYAAQDPAMTGYTEKATCGNYAVGGAQINPLAPSGAPLDNPLSVVHQIKHLAQEGLASTDLLMIAAGSNDAAALVENFLVALGTGDSVPLMKMLASRIDAATLDALVKQGQQGLAQAGGLYLQKVAELLATSIKAELLDKGAQHVAMLNVPPITMTPQFAAVLHSLEATQSPEVAQEMKQLFEGWVKAFNDRLAQEVKGEERVLLVDFHQAFGDQIRDPAKYGFSNVTVPACSVLGVSEDIYKCSADLLKKTIPAGETSPDWWSRYMFSNAFHPTPYGHQQMGVIMQEALKAKGWQP